MSETKRLENCPKCHGPLGMGSFTRDGHCINCGQSFRNGDAEYLEIANLNAEIAALKARIQELDERCSKVYCAYCSFEAVCPAEPTVLTDHAKVCEFHPMRKTEARLAAAEAVVEASRRVFCNRCEGNGMLWADGQAHPATYGGPSIPCSICGGSGACRDEDALDTALAALDGGAGEL